MFRRARDRGRRRRHPAALELERLSTQHGFQVTGRDPSLPELPDHHARTEQAVRQALPKPFDLVPTCRLPPTTTIPMMHFNAAPRQMAEILDRSLTSANPSDRARCSPLSIWPDRLRAGARSGLLGLRSEQRARLDLHARAHGRGDRDPLDEGALGARRLRLLHRVGERLDVLRRASPPRTTPCRRRPARCPAFSTRNSTEPPLAPFTASVTSIVTVPTFGFGIMPRGPSTLPRRPTSGIMSGVAMQRSKSICRP